MNFHTVIVLVVLGLISSTSLAPISAQSHTEGEGEDPLKNSLKAIHALPLIKKITYGDNWKIVVLGDHIDPTIMPSIYVHNPLDEGENRSLSLISIYNSSLSFSGELLANINISNIDFGSITKLTPNLLDIVKNIIEDLQNVLVVSTIEIVDGFESFVDFLAIRNSVILAPIPTIEYPYLDKSYTNGFLVQSIRVDSPYNIFDYSKYQVYHRIFSRSSNIFFVPGHGVNTTLNDKYTATVIFSIGVFTLLNTENHSGYRAVVALLSSSRNMVLAGTAQRIHVPDFVQAERRYTSSRTVIFISSPFDSAGYYDKEIKFNGGEALKSESHVFYADTTKDEIIKSSSTIYINQSYNVQIKLNGGRGLITIKINISIPMFDKSISVVFNITDQYHNSNIRTFSAEILEARGFIATPTQFELSHSFLQEVRRNGWALISWAKNFTSAIIDVWLINGLATYFKYEKLINTSVAKGSTAFLLLHPSDRGTWNQQGNYLSTEKIINVTDASDRPLDQKEFRSQGDTGLFYYNIPMQVSSLQSLINIDSMDLEPQSTTGFVFEYLDPNGDTTSVVDVYPLNGIYSSVLHKEYLRGNFFFVSDIYLVVDKLFEEQQSLVKTVILDLLNITSAVDFSVTQWGRWIDVNVATQSTLDSDSSAEIALPSGFKVSNLKMSHNGEEISIRFKITGNVVGNFTGYLKINYLPIIKFTFSVSTIPQFPILLSAVVAITAIIIYLKNPKRARCSYCGVITNEKICPYCERRTLV